MAETMRETEQFPDTESFYAAVDDVIATLDAAGETTRSSRIRQALTGSTSGEILPLLRHELRELRASSVARKLRLEDRLDALLTALDRAVARYGYH